MARLFDITTTGNGLALDAGGRGAVVFTVSNVTQKPVRGSLRVHALDAGQAAWLTIGGDTEREFTPQSTQSVEVRLAVPAGTPAGRFRIRLDALSVANPDDDFTEGPEVAVTIPAPAAPPIKKGMPWWVWVVIAVVVLALIGVVVYVVAQKKKDDRTAGDTPASAASTPTPTPVTQEFNDPRVSVPQGNLPLDVCRTWATDCGKPAADAYCQSKGMNSAVDFRVASDSPPTVVINTRQVCTDAGCDRITWLKCTANAAPLQLNAETRRRLETMRAAGKDIKVQP